MDKPFDLVGLGLNSRDYLFHVVRWPAAGESLPTAAPIATFGGQVATACIVARRFGLRVAYAGSIGGDAAGDAQRQHLARERLDLAALHVVPAAASQQAWIFADAQGERTIIFHRPPELAYPPDLVTPAWVASARILHLDGHDGSAAARAAEFAHQSGVEVSVDLSNVYPPQRASTDRLLAAADWLIVSQAFPARYYALDESSAAADPRPALDRLYRDFHPRLAALTLGAAGVLALDADGWHYAPGYVVPVTDTTGAGDVFHGGFLVGRLNAWPLDECLDFACALAALNCTAPGSQGHIATAAEVASFRCSQPRRQVHPALSYGAGVSDKIPPVSR